MKLTFRPQFQTFIVRKSSQPNTMALSVRLPKDSNGDNHKSLQAATNDNIKDLLIPKPSTDSRIQYFVQHYLIEQHQVDGPSNDDSNQQKHTNDEVETKNEFKSKFKMKLESSKSSFDNILSLVYHYLTVR